MDNDRPPIVFVFNPKEKLKGFESAPGRREHRIRHEKNGQGYKKPVEEPEPEERCKRRRVRIPKGVCRYCQWDKATEMYSANGTQLKEPKLCQRCYEREVRLAFANGLSPGVGLWEQDELAVVII